MSKKEATINQVLEVVQANQIKNQAQFDRIMVELGDLKKNSATKEDLKNFATSDEVASLGEFLQGQIYALHTEMRSGFRQVTGRIDRLEKKFFEDTNSFAEAFSDHEDRITYLEKHPANA